MAVKKNDNSKEKLYKELAELGADAEAFRKADPTVEELTTLVSGLRRAKNTINADKRKKKQASNLMKAVVAIFSIPLAVQLMEFDPAAIFAIS